MYLTGQPEGSGTQPIPAKVINYIRNSRSAFAEMERLFLIFQIQNGHDQ